MPATLPAVRADQIGQRGDTVTIGLERRFAPVPNSTPLSGIEGIALHPVWRNQNAI
jgi:hypothetical protein